MSFLKMSACAVSGASSMITSAHLATSAGVSTVRPCSSTLARDFEPSFRPTRTSTPESRRLSEWACPWLP